MHSPGLSKEYCYFVLASEKLWTDSIIKIQNCVEKISIFYCYFKQCNKCIPFQCTKDNVEIIIVKIF